MNVDETGRRAGADLRARFDTASTPAPDLSFARRGGGPQSRRRGALVGVALVLLIAVIIGLILSERDPEPASGPGGAWKRIDLRTGFGRDVGTVQIVARGTGFVAVGTRGVPKTGLRPAVWTSTDGLHWDAVQGTRFPSGRPFSGFRSVAARHGELVASTEATNQLWYSADAKTWRRASFPSAPQLDGIYVTGDPGAFIALGSAPGSAVSNPPQPAPVWTSVRGHSWSSVASTGAPPLGIGLFPAARLHRTWLAIESTALSDPDGRAAFASRDGLHWAELAKANVPDRFGNVLASNAARTRVLGIQFEHYEPRYSFGGRLWFTRNAKKWIEITSFHRQLPAANPDHLVRLGHWWVLGGNTGAADGLRSASMWTSPDLRHWYEMPKHLEGPESYGAAVAVTASSGKVVGVANVAHLLWVWSPPD